MTGYGNVGFNNAISIDCAIFRERRACLRPLYMTGKLIESRHYAGSKEKVADLVMGGMVAGEKKWGDERSEQSRAIQGARGSEILGER